MAGGAAHHPAEDAGLHPVPVQPGLVVVLHGYLVHREPGLLHQLQLHQIASCQAVELVVSVEVNKHPSSIMVGATYLAPLIIDSSKPQLQFSKNSRIFYLKSG